ITVPKTGEQTSFSDPVVSADRTAVGAHANFPNCCTSYDIPLQLVVHAAGRIHRLTGSGLPIFEWHFVDGGRRVAFGQETVHFSCSTHYELREVVSQRLVAAADVPEPCGQIPDPPPVKVPGWVKGLTAERK